MLSIKNQYYFYLFTFNFKEGSIETINDKNLIKQIGQVLRMKTQQSLVILDGKGTKALCQLVSIQKERVTVKCLKVILQSPPAFSFHLAVGALQREKLKQILSQSTQLGVGSIYILPTRYSKVKVDSLKNKAEYFHSVMKEALEQSTNVFFPTLLFIETFDEFFSLMDNQKIKIYVAHKDQMNLITKKTSHYNNGSILVIGPEGGFSLEELEQFKKNKASFISLGNGILKSETACIVGLSFLKMWDQEIKLPKDNLSV